MKIVLLIFFTAINFINAQQLNERQLDSLYNLILKINNISSDMPGHQTETEILKCGFGTINQVKLNIEKYSLEKQVVLKSLLDRPVKQTSMVSPSGFFRIHYNTTGSDIPRYNPSLTTEQNIARVAAALDSSYNFEIGFLGYPAPPSDNDGGGDNKYDVYINSLGNVYGYTEIETSLGNSKYTSFIVIDDNYVGFASTGLAGMQVTVAHEFHHAIQIGNYIFRSEDIFFYEITSTAMEEFVYDSVNDYYAYMSAYFNNPAVSLATTQGYEIAIWHIFLKDKFDYNIIKRQWELMPSSRAVLAMQNSLVEYNSSFNEALNIFGIWTFFTGHRARPGVFFEEASAYPLIDISPVINFNSPSSVQVLSKPLANNFIGFVNSSVSPPDTLVTIITNSDFISGVDSLNKNFLFNYFLSTDSSNGFVRLNDSSEIFLEEYFASFNFSESIFSVSEVLNNRVVRENGNINIIVGERDNLFVYPAPYFYSKNHNFLYIILNDFKESEYDFNVYTSGMELVFSKKLPVEKDLHGRTALRWDIRSLNKKLASGVYVFALRAGDQTHLGKLVIFNE